MSQISWTIVWIIVGALSKIRNVIKTFVMKNVLITIFFILSFAPMFAQTVPEKEIDFEGSFIWTMPDLLLCR